MKCIEQHTGKCVGTVEARESLSGTGTMVPRCDFHWDVRLRQHELHAAKYPDSDVPPSWFDPAYAGERWNEE